MPEPPGWVLVDDMILPPEAVWGDATWQATAWTGGVVPFGFDPNVSWTNQVRAMDAMADVAAAANLTFIPRTTQSNWIKFFDGTGTSNVNSSSVGMIGGSQTITIVSWTSRFIIVHEILHAMGFWHEHMRPDRNTYVTINFANIDTTYAYNFNLLSGSTAVGAYDFDSVMHYDDCAFTTCSPCDAACNSITAAAPYAGFQALMGQRSNMSLGDAAGLQGYYGAPLPPFISQIYPETGQAPPSGPLAITLVGGRFCRGSNNATGVLGTRVTWDGTAVSSFYASPTELIAIVPTALLTAAVHSVVVENPAPGGGTATSSYMYSVSSGTPDAGVLAWGSNVFGQGNPPAGIPLSASHVEIAAGSSFSVARRSDGLVTAWGNNASGQCSVLPLSPGLSYVEVACGSSHVVARRSDGSVVAWGSNATGQCNVPAPPAGTSYVQVSAGTVHSLARLTDGTAVAWGDNTDGQCNVPALPGGLNYTEVAAGGWHSVALRSDGSVVAWGRNTSGQCNVPPLPPGTVYVAVAAGANHTLARRSDGSVVAWGSNTSGQCNVPPLPGGYSFVEVSAGSVHSVARRNDGSVVAWGSNTSGQGSVPVLPAGFVYSEIAAGGGHTLARYSRAPEFSGTPTTGSFPLAVAFTDLSPPGTTGWSWDFGDGATSNLQNPTHTYTAVGSYTVTLSAVLPSGPSTRTKVNYITATPPMANFSGTPTSGSIPLQVSFTDLSPPGATSWIWTFGDGGTSTLQNPTHTYTAIGSYTVSLAAIWPGGSDSETKVGYIVASPTPPVVASLTPGTVAALNGGVITISGSNLTGATQVVVGGVTLSSPSGFTVVNGSTITFPAPPASVLGPASVTVVSPWGTSNAANLTYIETDPAVLLTPNISGTGFLFSWRWGAMPNNVGVVLIATDPTLYDFGTPFLILYNSTILGYVPANAAGVGELLVTVPGGLGGLTFYTQVGAVDPLTNFFKMTNVSSCVIWF